MDGHTPTLPDRWVTEVNGCEVSFGEGTLSELGAVVRRLGGERVLLVTDPGLEEAGHADRAVASLNAEGCRVTVFDQVEENPTSEHVEEGARVARLAETDLLVGLGGGSAMDCAKGINFLVSNGGRMEDYWGFGKAPRPMLPSVGVPTTAGTGSEAQSYALISQVETHRKMACGDPKARFRGVVLDPQVLRTVPRDVMAVSGFDAIAHAVESHVCTRRNPISQLLSREAWHLLSRSFRRVMEEAEDAGARSDMLLGAFLAGAAIEKSMLGLAHSCANPLTARFGVVHGGAVGLMLPSVVRFNAVAAEGLYGELLAAAGLSTNGQGNAGRLSAELESLRESAGLPVRLQEVGVESGALATLAAEAAVQWTAQFNPRPAAADDLKRLYETAF